MGVSRTLNCPERDWKSERTSDTRANDWLMRASRAAMLPVAATMLVAATNTGRPSAGSVNRGAPSKLMSTERCWFRFSEYVASKLALKRASRMPPLHDRFDRTVRGGRKLGEKSVTFGEEFENADPE